MRHISWMILALSLPSSTFAASAALRVRIGTSPRAQVLPLPRFIRAVNDVHRLPGPVSRPVLAAKLPSVIVPDVSVALPPAALPTTPLQLEKIGDFGGTPINIPVVDPVMPEVLKNPPKNPILKILPALQKSVEGMDSRVSAGGRLDALFEMNADTKKDPVIVPSGDEKIPLPETELELDLEIR